MRDEIIEASVLTAAVAICASLSALYEPRLLGCERTVRYWNWSFRGQRFMLLSSPMRGLGSYACNPLTKEAIVDDYLYHPGSYVPWPTQ